MASLAEYELVQDSLAPLLRWHLDDASGLPADSSGNSLPATSENISGYQQAGPFTGWDAIEVQGGEGASRASVGSQLDNFTFVGWVRPQVVSGGNQNIFSNDAGAGGGWALLIQTSGKLQGVRQGVGFLTQSNNALAMNTWYHVVITRRSGTWMYFLNGYVDTPNAGTGAPTNSFTTTKIFGSSSFQGKGSHFDYYDYALSDAQILDLYEAAAGPTTSPDRATWKVGTLTVPGSTGSVSVTGLGSQPKAVIFYGANWLTEDTAVTTTGTAVFRGMAAPEHDDPGTIVQNAAVAGPAGDQHTNANYAIVNLTTAGTSTLLYRATLDTLDATGFTVTFDTVSSGGYKVVYVALMDVGFASAFVGTCDQSSIAFGFKAGASLVHGAFGGPVTAGGGDRTQDFYGGGAYPGTISPGWESAGMAVFCTQGSGSTLNELTVGDPTARIASGAHGGIAGTFVPTNIAAAPVGAGLTNMNFAGDGDDGGMLLAWDDSSSRTFYAVIPEDEDDTETKTGLPFAPGLLLGYSISDEPTGFANYGAGAGRGAAGFAVVTPEFQWCALVDGVSSRGSYQSFQRGYCDNVSGTSVHAGTVELTDDGYVMTTVEDDLAASSLLWHAFGHPSPFPWIPRLYRVGPR